VKWSELVGEAEVIGTRVAYMRPEEPQEMCRHEVERWLDKLEVEPQALAMMALLHLGDWSPQHDYRGWTLQDMLVDILRDYLARLADAFREQVVVAGLKSAYEPASVVV
jgi:hypothetical protein